MYRSVFVLSLLLLCAAVQAEPVVLECDRLVDVDQSKLLKDQKILVDGGRIVAVGSAVDGGGEARIIRLDTCLPGLMDTHVHLDGQLSRDGYIERFRKNEADRALLAAHFAK